MLHLLLTRGLPVVCAASSLESLGVPVPAFPLLLLAGSVAAEYRFSAVPFVAASACGFWLGDLIWYAVGRTQGRRVLGLLCRLSLNPDACVGRAERRFRRRPALTVAAADVVADAVFEKIAAHAARDQGAFGSSSSFTRRG